MTPQENHRMVALSIGVSDAKPLPYLRGAVNGAQGFHDWATAVGYEAALVTDEDSPVTVARLRDELGKILTRRSAPNIHRLVLYFAGHGLIREAEEGLWLLSDWYHDLRAVAVEVLKRRLKGYGVAQISIFADACRRLPPDIDAADLTADGVLGRGQSDSKRMPAIDKFIAAQDGAEAYMIPGKIPNDDRCIFSGVLLEALWGTKPSAFSKYQQGKVTSSSLGTFLQTEVPIVAKRYHCELHPSVSPTFPDDDNVYVSEGTLQNPPSFQAWPDPKELLGLGGDVTSGGIPTENFTTRGGDINVGLAETHAQHPAKPSESLLRSIRQQMRPLHYETESGFAVEGQSVVAVWTTNTVFAEADRTNWWRVGHRSGFRLEKGAPVLIEFDDGLFAALTALPKFIGSVLRDDRGVAALIYREIWSAWEVAQAAESAIAKMESVPLRADAKTDLAVELRQGKHADPVRGVLSAYLYDSIGDVDSIRRMAHYYIVCQQPIPYDIALLAQLEGELRDGLFWAKVPAVEPRKPRTDEEKRFNWTWSATPACEGWIGGLWPWMRQGWAFLDNPTEDGTSLVLPQLIELTKHLGAGRFTTLDKTGARKLAEVFKLAPGDHWP